MPEFLPGALPAGIITVLTLILLRAQAHVPRISLLKIMLVGIAGAYLIPAVLAFLNETWGDQEWLPPLPVITGGQVFIGAWVGFAVLSIGNTKAKPRRIPLWAGAMIGVAAAVMVPPFLDRLTGSYQPMSLLADVNRCTRGMLGHVQPREATNVCDEPITVGLCLPGEVNPSACTQSHTIGSGQTARFEPGEARLSSLPGNPGGLTVVACRPPARPSRTLSVHGRGYDGVCVPPD